MKLKLIKSTWGMSGTYGQMFKQIADAGYAGVETTLPAADRKQEFEELLLKHGLDFIAQVHTNGNHKDSFAVQVNQAAAFNPALIVAHSARDCMGWEEQYDFFEHAIAIEKLIGISVAHETHRHRAMYAPWTTAALLKEFPDLKITADFSHWCCVCESLLEDQAEAIDLAIQRAIHVHARVGHAQGPQVPHPGAPEYGKELATHENWWEQIVKHRLSHGAATFTVTSEFGPRGYMPALPFTNQPVTDLWDVCLWMAKRFEAQFPKWSH